MGCLITIDGLDGCGKSTQNEYLASFLRASGLRVRTLKFPVYESESSSLVRLYLSGDLGDADDTNAYAASMLFAADRYVSFAQDWRDDHLDPDTVLVADRYTTANAIHQLSKLPQSEWETFLSWMCDFEFEKLRLPRPDLVIFLRTAPELSLRLVTERSDKTGVDRDIHERDADFVRRCRDAGNYACGALGWVPVECSRDGQMRSRQEIFGDIKRIVREFFAERNINL